ncbi:TPA: hypothetical protein JBI05_01125 [Legionella pneumophila]|nr:hypothetical protein [Legionella pneumophila]HAU1107060.1 hypothetical protein [Legionella pneumophila]
MNIILNHSIIVIASIIFTIGIILMIIANGSSGRKMRRIITVGFCLTLFALIVFSIFFILDVLPIST